jgi:hypothetical protein
MIQSALLVGWLLVGQAAAADAALAAEVPKLVRQLNAPQKAVREKARDRLLELGPRVLDLLPEPDPDTPAGVRELVVGIRRILQQTAADAAALGSRVTLHGRMPLSKILAALEAQSGNRIIDARRGLAGTVADPELAVAFQAAPFWSALDTVLDQAELTAYPFGQDGAIRVVARAAGQLPRQGRAGLAGPFRIEPVRVLARRDLRTAAQSLLVVTLEVAWEPRLRPIGLKQRLADVTALDERHRPLAVDQPQAEIEALVGRGALAVEMDVPLVLPAPPPKQIASLSGSLRAIVPGKVETFTFANLLGTKGKVQQRIAGATVALDQVRKNGDTWEVDLRVRFDEAGQALESYRNWILSNEAYLEGPEGRKILPSAVEPTERTTNEAGFRYLFDLKQSPAGMTLVYKTPGSIITRDFRYELRDIPLP